VYLLAPILAKLPDDIEHLILLPSDGLFLLPLHTLPLPGAASRYIGDHYQVRYAPSAEVLAACQRKAAQTTGYGLFAVINPAEDSDLVFTQAEGISIAACFSAYQVAAGRAGTKTAVVAGVPGKAISISLAMAPTTGTTPRPRRWCSPMAA
jgi:hypothetical protein